jgi:hypothetical protein
VPAITEAAIVCATESLLTSPPGPAKYSLARVKTSHRIAWFVPAPEGQEDEEEGVAARTTGGGVPNHLSFARRGGGPLARATPSRRPQSHGLFTASNTVR